MKNNFKYNLKQLRLGKHLSQENLAKSLHVSIKTISHWETGYSEPSVSQIIELAEFFEISTDELLCK